MSIAVNAVIIASALFNVGGPADEAGALAPFGNHTSTFSAGIAYQP